jgi:release factor glutamine methyltransferase
LALSIKNLLIFAQQKLADSSSARFDAEILMAHVLESKRSFLYANPELELPASRSETFKKLVKQRAAGQPVAYLVESSEFWSLPLKVNPAVLIPRPDTEKLVEAALSKIPESADWRIADLGTGSGAIALAIASERPKCEIHATDISPAAIQVARENARQLGFSQVQFYCGSWGEPLKGKFHLVVSNPPYIDANDPHLAMGDLRFEPRNALCPGVDGLSAIREICLLTKPKLLDGGWLMFEHGWEQGPASRQILQDAAYARVRTLKDLQGHERVTIGEKAGTV